MNSVLPAHARNPETLRQGAVQAFQAEAVTSEAAVRPRPEDRPREHGQATDDVASPVQTFTGAVVFPDAEARPRPVGRERPTVEQLASERPEAPTQMQVESDGTWLHIEAGRHKAQGLSVTVETDATWVRVEARAVPRMG